MQWDSYASRQSDADQLRRQSLQRSWTSSQTIWRRTSGSRTCHAAVSYTVAENFYLVSETKAQCESPFNCAPEIVTYLFTYLLTSKPYRFAMFNRNYEHVNVVFATCWRFRMAHIDRPAYYVTADVGKNYSRRRLFVLSAFVADI